MPEIKFLSHLENPPKGPLPLYTLSPAPSDTKAVLSLAQQFGLAGTPDKGRLTEQAATLTYAEGPLQVTLHRASGGVRFQDLQRWQVDDGSAHIDIPDVEAIAIAKRQVKKLALAPPDEIQVLKVTRLRVGTAEASGKKAEERIIDVGVAFQRLVGGIPVDGPGGKLIVYLDHEGQVTGVDRLWRTIKRASKPIAVQPPEFAERDLVKYWGKAGTDGAGRIEVREVRFGYFEQGWNEVQTVLQPAYVLPLTLISGDERVAMKSVHVIAASVKPSGVLMPPAKKPLKLRPRKLK